MNLPLLRLPRRSRRRPPGLAHLGHPRHRGLGCGSLGLRGRGGCGSRGRREVVVIEDNFGVRITEIVQAPGIEMLAGGK